MVTHCKRLRPLVPLAWMGVIWVLSSIPAKPDQTMAGLYIPKVLQKLMHVAAYAALAGVWFWLLDFGRVLKTAGVWAFGLAVAYAAVDEFHQTFVSGRYGSPQDVALDAVGAALAVMLIARLHRSANAASSGESHSNRRGVVRLQ